MKNNWQTKRLGEVCEIVNGGTPKTNVPRYWDGDILWITPKDMGRLKNIFVNDTGRKITEAGLKDSSAKIIPPESIILSSRAPIGYLAISKKELCTNQGCKGIVPKKELDIYFLFYFLKNSVDLLNKLGSGTTFKELSSTKLKEVQIPFPSLVEQKRIVQLLDGVFEKIEKAKGNAEKNLQNSRELFESYLRNIFTNIDNHWEEKTIDNIGKIGTGATPLKSNKKYYGGNISWITSKSTRNPFIKEADDYITDLALKETNCKLNSIHTLIIAMYGQGKTRGQVSELLIGAATNQAIATVLVDENKIDRTFVKYFFVFNYETMRQMAEGGLQLNLNLNKIKKMKIPFPKPLSQQKEIVIKLDELSGQTRRLEEVYKQKIADLEELKKSVLDKAFKGEL